MEENKERKNKMELTITSTQNKRKLQQKKQRKQRKKQRKKQEHGLDLSTKMPLMNNQCLYLLGKKNIKWQWTR